MILKTLKMSDSEVLKKVPGETDKGVQIDMNKFKNY